MQKIPSLVLKGFTVPEGYLLIITKKDGETVEKRPGENSGGHYSFSQILEGSVEGWELLEESTPPPVEYIKMDEEYDFDFGDDDEAALAEPTEEELLDRKVEREIYEGSLKPTVSEAVMYALTSVPKINPKLSHEEIIDKVLSRHHLHVFSPPPLEMEYDTSSIRPTKNKVHADNIASIDMFSDPKQAMEALKTMYLHHHNSLKILNEKVEVLRGTIRRSAVGDDISSVSYPAQEYSAAKRALHKQTNEIYAGFRDYFSRGVEVEDVCEEDEATLEEYFFESLDGWEEVKKGMLFPSGFVHSSLSEFSIPISVGPSRTSDGRASATRHTISVDSSVEPSTVAHEMAHVLELQNDDLLSLNVIPFLLRRVGKDERSVRLSEATGDNAYDAREVCFEDDFKVKYAGKIYSYITSNFTLASAAVGADIDQFVDGIMATEVLSMGMQQMFEDPVKFAEDDPDFFSFIWSLRHKPRVSKFGVKK